MFRGDVKIIFLWPPFLHSLTKSNYILCYFCSRTELSGFTFSHRNQCCIEKVGKNSATQIIINDITLFQVGILHLLLKLVQKTTDFDQPQYSPGDQYTVGVETFALYIFSRYSRFLNIRENMYAVKINFSVSQTAKNT